MAFYPTKGDLRLVVLAGSTRLECVIRERNKLKRNIQTYSQSRMKRQMLIRARHQKKVQVKRAFIRRPMPTAG